MSDYLIHKEIGVYHLNINDVELSTNYSNIIDVFNLNWVPSIFNIKNGVIADKYQYLNEKHYTLSSDEQIENSIEHIQLFYDWIERVKL